MLFIQKCIGKMKKGSSLLTEKMKENDYDKTLEKCITVPRPTFSIFTSCLTRLGFVALRTNERKKPSNLEMTKKCAASGSNYIKMMNPKMEIDKIGDSRRRMNRHPTKLCLDRQDKRAV